MCQLLADPQRTWPFSHPTKTESNLNFPFISPSLQKWKCALFHNPKPRFLWTTSSSFVIVSLPLFSIFTSINGFQTVFDSQRLSGSPWQLLPKKLLQPVFSAARIIPKWRHTHTYTHITIYVSCLSWHGWVSPLQAFTSSAWLCRFSVMWRPARSEVPDRINTL